MVACFRFKPIFATPQLPQNIMATSKVVKSDSKIIISIVSVKHHGFLMLKGG